ncbi:BUD13 homolog [Hippoglossus hippoglossus]|uniref:BUD13 homolog n=1 Tax=Hippoglossus hippoglossus TaxID=8267 RepID=UPI00148B5058|nr:BUD13 homolog [Hippoglossus hippoglossus]
MAASAGRSEGTELSRAEYLKRYLSTDEDAKKSKGKLKKKRSKVPERGLKIVDDDIDWKQMVAEEQEDEEDEEEAPVVAEMIDDRPEEVKQLEAFRTGNRWKVIGADEDNDSSGSQHDSPDASPTRRDRHDSPDISPPREGRHDSLDISSPRRDRHDSPDLSPSRQHLKKSGKGQSKDSSPTGRQPSKKHSPDPSGSPLTKRDQNRHDSDSDQSPPRKKPVKVDATDLDQSPPRRRSKRKQEPDTDQSPPRRRPKSGRDSDEDLSPPRRPGQSQAGLVSVDVLRKEKEENRRRERKNKPLEDESRNAQTVFRDKSGKRRDLESEREEQKRKAGVKAAKDEKYAQWGRGLAQGQMHQQNLEDAMHEVHKPLARHSDDKDLDRMLREQERDGDPMAAMLRRKKVRSTNTPAKPQYKGPPPPPNRFNLPPGYRWDGVDRSNGFEKKRYSRIADKKAVQDAAYKWSVEDM